MSILATDFSGQPVTGDGCFGQDRKAGAPAHPVATGRRPAQLALYMALGFQFLSAVFFVGELWTEILGLRTTPIPWQLREIIQLLASVGLVTGVAVTAVYVSRSRNRLADLSRQVDVVSGNFEQHLLASFDGWGLSKSEQAITLYTMKGFSNSEIANLRGTSVSTIKSQLNAVYRKTGLSNRQQLISFLVEELLAGMAVDSAPEEDNAIAA